MASLIELAASIVESHASTTPMSSEDLLQEIQKVYATLKALEEGKEVAVTQEEGTQPTISLKDAFKKNEVVCMICGKGGMKTLARHLSQAHDMKPGEYRKQFGIPRTQPLAAKSFSEARRQMAKKINLAANLEKARAARMAKITSKKAAPAKKSTKKPAQSKTGAAA
jgi:predicted transcriptional regulator